MWRWSCHMCVSEKQIYGTCYPLLLYEKLTVIFCSSLHSSPCCHTLVSHFGSWVLLKVKHKSNLKNYWRIKLIARADMSTRSP